MSTQNHTNALKHHSAKVNSVVLDIIENRTEA
jgi:hypothetical protein